MKEYFDCKREIAEREVVRETMSIVCTHFWFGFVFINCIIYLGVECVYICVCECVGA